MNKNIINLLINNKSYFSKIETICKLKNYKLSYVFSLKNEKFNRIYNKYNEFIFHIQNQYINDYKKIIIEFMDLSKNQKSYPFPMIDIFFDFDFNRIEYTSNDNYSHEYKINDYNICFNRFINNLNFYIKKSR